MSRRSSEVPGATSPEPSNGTETDTPEPAPEPTPTEEQPSDERSTERDFDVLELLTRRPPMLVASGILMVFYAVLVASAVLASPIVFACALVLCTIADVIIERYSRPLVAVLRRAQFGISHRVFVQTFMFLLLVAVTNGVRGSDRAQLTIVTCVAIGIPVARVFYLGMLTLIRRRQTRVVEVRNLDVPALEDTKLPNVLTKDVGTRLLIIGVLPVLAGAVSVQIGSFWLFLTVAATYILVVAVGSIGLGLVLLRYRNQPKPEELLAEVAERLGEHRPEVMLYFSGSAKSIYQANVWLDTLAATDRPTFILLRERHLISNLAPTNLPVVCIPSPTDLMAFALPDVRVALYASNVGKNIHFLREPRVKHVFIGHGDSDKVGSFNPFSKVYAEVWVAGQGGRDRYAKARVGVQDENIVEVGRPQLDLLSRWQGYDPSRPLTVLYAPTWEGWTDDEFQTSVTDMGPEIIRQLLASPVPVRVMYKPHPFTGIRDPRAAESHQAMKALLDQANERFGEPDSREWDQLEKLVEQILEPDITPEAAAELEEKWQQTYWRLQGDRHVVVTGSRPRLFDCFDRSDMLIADVSSVVSDWVATGKPYVVANPDAMLGEEFREEYPSTGAAYLLGPGCPELGAIMNAVTGDDPMAQEREQLRVYLLGPEHPTAMERWNTAIENLIERADQDWDGEHGAGPVEYHNKHRPGAGTDTVGEQNDDSDDPGVGEPGPVDQNAGV